MALNFRSSSFASGMGSDTTVQASLVRVAGDLTIAFLSWVPQGGDEVVSLGESGWTRFASGSGDLVAGAALALYWRREPASASPGLLVASFTATVGSPKLALLAYTPSESPRALAVSLGAIECAGSGTADMGGLDCQPRFQDSLLLHCFRLRSVGLTIASGAGGTPTERVRTTGISVFEGASTGAALHGAVVAGGAGPSGWAAALVEIRVAPHPSLHPADATFRPSKVYEDPRERVFVPRRRR